MDHESVDSNELFPPGEPGVPDHALVVSPALGRFQPLTPQVVTAEGEILGEGACLGTVAGKQVRAFRAGWLIDMLVRPGERVKAGQPLAVLRLI